MSRQSNEIKKKTYNFLRQNKRYEGVPHQTVWMKTRVMIINNSRRNTSTHNEQLPYL